MGRLEIHELISSSTEATQGLWPLALSEKMVNMAGRDDADRNDTHSISVPAPKESDPSVYEQDRNLSLQGVIIC